MVFCLRSIAGEGSELLHFRPDLKTAAMFRQQAKPRGAVCELAERRRSKICRHSCDAEQALRARSEKLFYVCEANKKRYTVPVREDILPGSHAGARTGTQVLMTKKETIQKTEKFENEEIYSPYLPQSITSAALIIPSLFRSYLGS